MNSCAEYRIPLGFRPWDALLGLYIAGGKGGVSRKTPQHITEYCERYAPEVDNNRLIETSKLSAKVDNTALQDGYQLYHHVLMFDKNGSWAVVQQGMNETTRYARRYHWLGESINDMVDEPHAGVCCDHKTRPLNLVAHKSIDSRKAITEISREHPDKMLREWKKISTLTLPSHHPVYSTDIQPKFLEKVLVSTYENPAQDFKNVLLTRGMGPKSLRALTLLSEVIHGAKPSFEDPVQYSFAHGGKDGFPYPVNRNVYQKSILVLKEAVEKSRIGHHDKSRALKRLSENFPES
jgi:hypothetical protein